MEPQGGEGAGRELPRPPFRGTRLSASLSGCPRPGQPGLDGSEEPLHAARSSAHGGPAAASLIGCSRQPIGAGAGDGATSFIHS